MAATGSTAIAWLMTLLAASCEKWRDVRSAQNFEGKFIARYYL